jgi:DnaJ like chaperone protein
VFLFILLCRMPFSKPTKEARKRANVRRAETRERLRAVLRNEAVRASFAYVASVDGKPTSKQARAFTSYLAQNGCSSSVPLGRAKTDSVTNHALAQVVRAFLSACRPSLASRRKLVRDLRVFARLDGAVSSEVDEALALIADLFKTGRAACARPAERVAVKPHVRRSVTPRCYEMLGCSPDDSDEVIKRRYRELAAALHPDKHAAKVKTPQDAARYTADFQQLQLAYEEIRRLRQMGK